MVEATPENVKVGKWMRTVDEVRKWDGIDGVYQVVVFQWFGDRDPRNEIEVLAYYDWEDKTWMSGGSDYDIIRDMGLNAHEYEWTEGMSFVVYEDEREALKDIMERPLI